MKYCYIAIHERSEGISKPETEIKPLYLLLYIQPEIGERTPGEELIEHYRGLKVNGSYSMYPCNTGKYIFMSTNTV